MSEVGQHGEPGESAGSPGRNKAVTATVLGALSLLTPLYFVIVMFLQMLEPHSYIGMNALYTVPLSPVSAILAGVGIWLARRARRDGANAGVGLTLCILGLIASLTNFALVQPWRAFF
ncbi:hypothetical protein [Gulosibacter sediminis]|uniref:hypothetical protein n=1 Tax=Gulosibacter sediminis TaxID=1729695 RepID=UPI0024ADBFF2|nr:hypothetical protein [Gulosibacter sediminis]